MKLLAVAWGTLASAPIIAGVLQYLTPPPSDQTRKESLPVASVNDIPPGAAKVVRFQKEPLMVVHTKSGQFKAFSARCTHLGCVVQYVPDPPHFECHCHGSVFSEDGKNISGLGQQLFT